MNATGRAARFNTPWGIAIDRDGNLYVSDQNNNRIRKITTPGAEVTTFAGNGDTIILNHPNGLAIDPQNNLYVADEGHNMIRVISIASGIMKPFAGTGVKDSKDGAVAMAAFSSPVSIAINSKGEFYIGESGFNKIRFIDASKTVGAFAGGSITGDTLNGTGKAARFSDPQELAIDAKGVNLYVCDHGNHQIRKVTIPGAVVSSVVGSVDSSFHDGIGKAAGFNGPMGMTMDAEGDLYVTDYYNHSIRKILVRESKVITIAGNGAPGFINGYGTSARFNHPSHIAIDKKGILYVTDAGNYSIRKLIPIGR